jgi:hypothetical protein
MVLPDFHDYMDHLGLSTSEALLNWTETVEIAGDEWGEETASLVMNWLEDNRHEEMAEMIGLDPSLHGNAWYSFGGEVFDVNEVRFGELRVTDRRGRSMEIPMNEVFEDWVDGQVVEPVSRRFVGEGQMVIREEDLRDTLTHLVGDSERNFSGRSRDERVDLIMEELR